MKRQKAVIDGTNALYLHTPRDPRPNIKNVFSLADIAEQTGLEPTIVFDPGIRPLITDAHEFEKLLSDARVLTVPEGKDAGLFVLETADNLNALIVSNNTYAECVSNNDWVENRRIPIAIVDGAMLLLLEQKFRRAG